MFRSQFSASLKEVIKRDVSSFQELEALIEDTPQGIIAVNLKGSIYWDKTLDCGGKCILVAGNRTTPPLITVKDGVWLFKNKKPTTTYSKVGFYAVNINFEGGGGFVLGSGLTCHLNFSVCEVSLKNTKLTQYGQWQQVILTANGTFKDIQQDQIISFGGCLILNEAGSKLLDAEGNSLRWADVIGGIVRDSNGIPRNVMSNVVL